MEELKSFKLVLNDKIFMIPTNFQSINDVNPDILTALFKNHEYKVDSNVDANVLQSFINNWVSNETINLDSNNILQFQLLSNEFDRIKDIVALFQLKTAKISFFTQRRNDIKHLIQERTEILDKKQIIYHKIIKILLSTEKVDFHSIFSEKKAKLIEACQIGDCYYVDTITRYKIEKDGLLYTFNETEKTASLAGIKSDKKSAFVPRSICHENQEYLVTSISDYSFYESGNLKSIEFADDSELRRIGKYAFSESSLKSISIPSSVEIIEECCFTWCTKLKKIEFKKDSKIKIIENHAFSNTPITHLSIPSSVCGIKENCFLRTSKLNHIEVIENEVKNIALFDDSFILGKTSKNQENFDVLILSRRDIKSVIVPSFIKVIDSCAFQNCSHIDQFEFQDNSELTTIGKWSFSSSSVSELFIPSKVTTIKEYAFLFCNELQKIEFKEDSKIESFEFSAFASSSLNSLSIPSSIVDFHDECFRNVHCLNNIKVMKTKKENICYYKDTFILGKSSQNQENFDVLILARKYIKKVEIPSFIKIIKPYAFQNCSLNTIEFQSNSNLITIGKYAFSSSNIQNIKIPSSVCQLCNSSFSGCRNLEKVEFSNDSNLYLIDNCSFASTFIRSITIPSSTSIIKDDAFQFCSKLNEIKIIQRKEKNFDYINDSLLVGKSTSNQKNFDVIIIANKEIKKVTIPSFIKTISSFAFYFCFYLEEVEFSENSELISIESDSFSMTSIEKIKIPSHVKTIGNFSFLNCKKLKKIEFQENSELERIGENAFGDSFLESLCIPSSIIEIDQKCFCRTGKLNYIEVFPNKNIQNVIVYRKSILLGKSSPNVDGFDAIIVARRNVKRVKILPFVKHIYPYAFYECNKIRQIEFPQNSQLVSIGSYAFTFSSINCVFIPRHVESIDSTSFFVPLRNQLIEIDENSELKSIKGIFNNNGNIIMIPNKLKNIEL